MDPLRRNEVPGGALPPQPRRFARYRVAAYADITADDVLLYHRIAELSVGGMSYTGPSPVPVGARIDAVLNFPRTDAAVWVTGQVVWTTAEAGGTRIGLSWLGLGEVDRAELRRHVEGAQTGVVGTPVRTPYQRRPTYQPRPLFQRRPFN